MFRKEIKVLDCTIRDGGLINNYQFSEDFVKAVYRAICDAGVDIIELGKKLMVSEEYSRDKYGVWNFCDEDVIRGVVDSYQGRTKPWIAVMLDIGRVDLASLGKRGDTPFDMIRTACYVPQVDKGLDAVKRCKDQGYITTLNIMAVSAAIETEIHEALEAVAKVPELDVLYLVDTYGSYYSEQVTHMLKLYSQYVPMEKLGYHGHNNQQLAFANTQQAIIDGVNMLDATVNGIGRGAGNCCLELLLGFLKNPKFDVRPIYKVIQECFLPLRKEIEWGFNDIYVISGVLNQHPREAMAFRGRKSTQDHCLTFYDHVTRQDANID